MAEALMMFGSREHFGLSLEWSGVKTGSAAEVTRGEVVLWVDGRPLWGTRDEGVAEAVGIEWTWVELLEFLAEAWPHLEWEQSYPPPLNPRSPMDLETEIERIRTDESPEYANDIHEEVMSFLEVHDLARALQGATAEPVRFLRQGLLCIVGTRPRDILLPIEDVLSTLQDVGNEVATRLALSGDERAQFVLKRWDARDRSADVEFVLRYGAGLEESSSEVVEPYLMVRDGRYFEDEILAAARMATDLVGDDALGRMLEEISKIEKLETPALDDLEVQVKGAATAAQMAWEQGYSLARAARPLLPDTQSVGRVEIEHVLESLGVQVMEVSLGADVLDAIAVFGKNHGPAILVNSDGRHAQGEMGRRATLGHELCHLLFDREGALPFAEALGPLAPEIPEKRARAFAAELILPQQEALARALKRQPASRVEWQELVDNLGHDFGASQELVAWQLVNGHRHQDSPLPSMVERWLAQLARPRR